MSCSLHELGFEGAEPAATGRPSYHPAVLLKIYIYGYLNRVQSSRRLEREAQRNVELMWLTGRLAPDFKTIADFRKDHGDAIRKVCREFVLLCRRLKLFTDGIVAIDGSKFKAVNNRDKNFTDRKLQARMEQLEDSIKRYLVELDRADRDATAVLPSRVAHLKEKIAKVKEQMQALGEIGEQMKASRGWADLADRSRCALHGHQRPRHRHRRLQRADRRGCQAPHDRGPRGHQRRPRPGPTGEHGQARQGRPPGDAS